MSNFLSGVRVLDLSRILAGPWATQNLADLGADVIKIERPGTGDDTRQMGPPFMRGSDGELGDAAYFMCCNRGKKSLTLDFTQKEGQALLHELVETTDIVVENYKVGGLDKYNLDYGSLSKIKPDLIYCSVTGFGHFGPYSKRAGYDYLIQAMSGLMSITGEADEVVGGGPQKVGLAVSDLFSGMYATVAILAALRHRDHGGGGQHIDISLLDCQVGTLANQALNYLATGIPPKRLGTSHPNIAPYQAYRAKDGYLVVAIGNDAQFLRFCKAVNQIEVASDPRFISIRDRVKNRGDLEKWMCALMLSRDVENWVTLLADAQVPCGPINNLEQVFDDPHVRARGMQIELLHEKYGHVPNVRNPMIFSGKPLDAGIAPPLLGQHTNMILHDLGLDEAAIKELRLNNVV